MRLLLLSTFISCVLPGMDPVVDTPDFENSPEVETEELSSFMWSEAWALGELDSHIQSLELSIVEQGPWVMRSGGGSPMAATKRTRSSAPSSGSASVPRRSGGTRSEMPAPDSEMMADIGGEGPIGGSMVSQGSLRAGSTDDNLDFDDYLSFLQTWVERPDVAGRYDATNVSGQRWIQVRDARGAPLPGARVSVVDTATERVVWSGTTFGDGRMPFYPSLDPVGAPVVDGLAAPGEGWLVQAAVGDLVQSKRWTDDSSEFEMKMDWEAESGPVQLDVAFVIDTTGSMSDEIARIKQTLLSLTDRLGDEQEVELRYGAVLYRDLGDEYVTSRHPFTTDLEAFDEALQQIQASGGGDMPESMNQGLAEAVGSLEWRDGVAKVAFVIADAPPHTDYQSDTSYSRSTAAALHKGIRIHTVAASGLDDLGSLVFRQVAQLTRGKFIFIEYGSTAASAADHGVTGRVSSNNLDDILYEQIRSEIQGWGRELEADVAHMR